MSVDGIALASAAATLFVFRKGAGVPDLHKGF
ncbi:hypothetical protein FHS68_002267 [Dyadobacter arcticus]|uniref:Uncharacterized protein n=1 Tax=Dyadobacter arcticus TaxID=1078754 RepID=A0ABX0UJK7_9BACT|nr:hypothetical protein [Dyadobacter arcticus]